MATRRLGEHPAAARARPLPPQGGGGSLPQVIG
jgi:hypothetical protein